MTKTLPILELSLHGGHPALDYVNTVDWRDRQADEGGAVDTLTSYDALLAWCRRCGIIGAATEAELERQAAAAPPRASAVLTEAVALREALYGLARSTRLSKTARPADLEILNKCLLRYPEGRSLAPSGQRFVWKSHGDGIALGSPLGAIARLAAELLVTAEPASIRCCAGTGCGWLFHDSSPNKRRRWCSMESCGNRAKARRHYERVKTAH